MCGVSEREVSLLPGGLGGTGLCDYLEWPDQRPQGQILTAPSHDGVKSGAVRRAFSPASHHSLGEESTAGL